MSRDNWPTPNPSANVALGWHAAHSTVLVKVRLRSGVFCRKAQSEPDVAMQHVFARK